MSRIAFLASVAFSIVSTAACAQTAVGTISVCYYSTKCAYAANAVDPPAKVRMAQAVRDSGEHQGATKPAAAVKTYEPIDAPAFQIVNTGTLAITDAYLTMLADTAESVPRDTYHIGTIKPGRKVTIVPGNSNDKKTHPSTGLFYFRGLGDPLDTSDAAPNANAVTLVFTGKIGTQAVTSGKIVASASVAPSADGTVAALNFLGGPGNSDGPCGDCVDPEIIGTINYASP